MNLIFLVLIISMLHLAMTPAYGVDADSYNVVALGQWHGDEVTAKNGETWHGLFESTSRVELISGKVIVDAIYDEMVDNKPEDKSGKRVRFTTGEKTYSAGDNGAPMLLLRGGGISTGEVKVLGNDQENHLVPGRSIYLDAEHSLAATAVVIDGQYPNAVDIRDYCVKLVVSPKESNYNHFQKVFCLDRVDQDAGVATLIFAGDLDRDGIPDVILSGSEHYNVSNTQLFLSSPQNEKLDQGRLKKVAEFRTTGC